MGFSFYSTYFVGESVDDCGGGYSESVAEMCDELQNGSLPLLVLTPNGRDDAGTNKDCFLLNPAVKSSLHMEMFRFLGNVFQFNNCKFENLFADKEFEKSIFITSLFFFL